jgi:hypothetical protein
MLFPAITFAGFGVSPADIGEDQLVPGSSYERTVYLVQGAPDKQITVDAIIDTNSEEVSSWITVQQGGQFVIPEGVQQFPVTISVDIPETTELGVYKASLRFNTVPDVATGAGQVAIALAAKVDMELVVGDDVVSSYEVKLIEIEDIAEGDDAHARIKIQNTGNVPTAPERVSFELFNKFGDIRLSYAEQIDVVKVPSFSEQTVDVFFPLTLSIASGEYWGQVKVYDDNGVVYEEKTIFNVSKKTFIEKNAPYVYAGIVISVLFIVLIVGTLVLWRVKRGR